MSEEGRYVYVLTGMHPEQWRKLSAELGIEGALIGFSNKEPHVQLTLALAKRLREEYRVEMTGPYAQTN
jgi:hypothetical protein